MDESLILLIDTLSEGYPLFSDEFLCGLKCVKFYKIKEIQGIRLAVSP